VPAPPPTDTWRVRWSTVPNLIDVTAPAKTPSGREERIFACAARTSNGLGWPAGDPRSIRRRPCGPRTLGPRVLLLSHHVSTRARGDIRRQRRRRAGPSGLQAGCPGESAPWWGKPLRWAGH